MLIDLSAKELAYVTAVVSVAPIDVTGINALGMLKEACLTDVQALGYLHEYEDELNWQQPDTLRLAADKLDNIVDRHLPIGRWADVR
jgi:hypothetical protein